MSRRGGVVEEAGRFARANLSSSLASGLEWLLVATAIHAGVHYLVAAAAGAVTGAVTDFSLKRWWAFDRTSRAAIGHEGARYLGVSGGSLALNLGISYLLVDGMGIGPVVGVVSAAIVVGLGWNYPLHRLFVFREAHAVERTGPG